MQQCLWGRWRPLGWTALGALCSVSAGCRAPYTSWGARSSAVPSFAILLLHHAVTSAGPARRQAYPAPNNLQTYTEFAKLLSEFSTRGPGLASHINNSTISRIDWIPGRFCGRILSRYPAGFIARYLVSCGIYSQILGIRPVSWPTIWYPAGYMARYPVSGRIMAGYSVSGRIYGRIFCIRADLWPYI